MPTNLSATNPEAVKFISYWGGMLVFLGFELARSYRPTVLSKARRWLANIPLSLANGAVYHLIYGQAIDNRLAQTAATAGGLLNIIPMPEPIKVLAGIMVLDLSIYLWHLANHVVPLFWRFHRVHHSDMNMDVSTANRFHLGEFLVSGAIRLAVIGVFGIPAMSYLIFELTANLAIQFHHSSIAVPARFERAWWLLFVPPSMHRIHHSVKIRERDSNYGVIFSFWDRLFGTMRDDVDQDGIVIGIGSHRQFSSLGFLDLLAMPFTKASR